MEANRKSGRTVKSSEFYKEEKDIRSSKSCKRKSRMIFLSGIISVLHFLAWASPVFCDWYIKHIHPLILNTYGLLMGCIPFSVGEWMLLTGVLTTAAAFAAVIFFLLGTIYEKRACSSFHLSEQRNETSLRLFLQKVVSGVSGQEKWKIDLKTRSRRYLAFYAEAMLWVALVMTCNCLIGYHCTPLEEKYGFGISEKVMEGDVEQGEMEKEETGKEKAEKEEIYIKKNRKEGEKIRDSENIVKEYGLQELRNLREYLVRTVNHLSLTFDRTRDGEIFYKGDLNRTAVESMQRLGQQWEQLGGYYPRAKKLTFSGFFSQQMIKGYFFPFSMEANYNGKMKKVHRPATICHEYAHLKGFMFEEEANMIGFLACIYSPDPYFRYSGYLSVLNYVDLAFFEAIGKNREIYFSCEKISEQVKKDNEFLSEESWKEVEEMAVISTEVVEQVSRQFTETTLTLNGVEDGIMSYNRVVELLLQYYDAASDILDASK